MEESKICPKCQSNNPNSSSQCINCGYSFDDSKNNSDSWLDMLRETGELKDSISASGEEVDGSNDNQETINSIPDWLNRIQNIQKSDQDQKSDVSDPIASHWLDDFRNISNQEQSTENKEELEELSPDEKPTEDEESSQSLLSIDEIKQDWQNEFPSLLENIDNEDISPAENLPDWLSKDIEFPQDSNETIPDSNASQTESYPTENRLDDTASEFPEWLNHKKDSQIHEIEDEIKEETSIPIWLRGIDSGQKGHLSNTDDALPDEKIEEEEVIDSELLFNKLEINFENHSDESENVKQKHGSDHEELENKQEEEKDPHTSAFIFSNDDLISEKPFIGEDDEFLSEDYIIYPEDKSNLIQDDFDESPDEYLEDSQKFNSPFTFEDIPEWLEKVDLESHDFNLENLESGGDKSKQTQIEEGETSSKEITKGNLPEWLKVFRPIEALTPDVSKIKQTKNVENSGPLAGFKGVLSTESITKSYTTSTKDSLNINVSERQYTHAKLLEEIVSPINIQDLKQRERNPSSYMAIFIPAIFIFILVLSFFFNPNQFNSVINIPPETVRFHNLITGYINQNQEPRNILLITEAESGAYPEINLITADVLEDIFKNNHYLTSLSTNPNGVIVSESIQTNASLNVPSYNYLERVLNLGYLPGKHLGIQSFLSNPKESFPQNSGKVNDWKATQFANINSVSDYDLLIILADNSENARVWIEQIELVDPSLGVLVISTTQSIPMLRPYINSNQIDGMIGGISGALAFSSLSQSDTTELAQFRYIIQIAVLAIIIFILMGSMVTIFSNKNQSGSKKKNN